MPAFDGCYGQGCELLVFQWAFGLNLTDDILTEKKRDDLDEDSLQRLQRPSSFLRCHITNGWLISQGPGK